MQGTCAIGTRPSSRLEVIGRWRGETGRLAAEPGSAREVLFRLASPVFVVRTGPDAIALTSSGQAELGSGPSVQADDRSVHPLLALAPALPARSLGDPEFRREHGVAFAIVAGAMAGGIASVELVEAMARAGMLAFYGAAGLPASTVDRDLERLQTRLLDRPFGCNLIHSPYEPRLEADVADLYVRRGIRRVSASAYLDLTLPLLRYRLHGIHQRPDGTVVTPNHVFAKVSRVEVACKFLAPPPAALVEQLVSLGHLDLRQAELARSVPVAEALTAEADSGGHTDNQPALTLLPTMLELRDRMQAQWRYAVSPRVGLAGGMATPSAIAAALSMGAAYVMTGSVNQSCREAGTSDHVRQLLSQAEQADTTMAPAADMFEMGVKLQVLRRGTLFPGRARKLWDLWRDHASLDAIAPALRRQLEQTVFQTSLEAVWEQTQAYWAERDPSTLERARNDEKIRMALCFRWYLGQSSRWANAGVTGREADYQIWCGPSMGAFNAWARGSVLESWTERRVVVVNLNLIHAAAVLMRVQALRNQGIDLRPEVCDVRPRPLAELEEFAL